MSSDDSTPLRADRFHLLVGQLRGVPYLTPEEAIAATPLTPWGEFQAAKVTDDDLALAWAAIDFEAERRRRGWDAIERLGALLAGTSGPLDERIASLPRRRFVEAAGYLLDLGWIDR
jgi:hypothetical protein